MKALLARRLRPCSALLICGILPAIPPEQRPDIPEGNVPGGNYSPNAGYAATVRLQLLERRRLEALAAPGMNLAPGPRAALGGSPSVPVICVKFRNSPDVDPYPASELAEALFGQSPPGSAPRATLRQYYHDMSNGKFRPQGEVAGWFRLPQDDYYYEGASNGLKSDAHLREFVQESLKAADVAWDFSKFDNDGPDKRPNSGDDDGVVDTVFIVHAEQGGECADSRNLWSHSYHYSSLDPQREAFVTGDIRLNAEGKPVLGPDGEPDRIRIDDYTLQPALACGLEKKMIAIGVFCHEYGHALGLPDLYDRTPRNADSEGVGHYCCMASGSYGADGEHPERPVQFSAWCKAMLGWANIRTVSSNSQIQLRPVQEQNDVYAIDVPGTAGREYFLLEYRPSVWKDDFGEKLNWDQDFNGGGLFVWHVDDRVGGSSSRWPFAEQDRGQNDAPSRPGSNGVGFSSNHSLVALVQADRMLDLERDRGRGIRDDHPKDLFLTGSSFGDDPEYRAGSRGYDNKPSGIRISGIQLEGSEPSALVVLDDFPEPVLADRAADGVPSPDAGAPGVHAQAEADSTALASLARSRETSATPLPDADKLREIDRKLARGGPVSLAKADKEVLAATEAGVLRHYLSKATIADAVRVSVNERIERVPQGYEAKSPLEEAVSALVEQSAGAAPVGEVQFAPAEDKVERITGISVPAEGEPVEDARKKLDEELRPLLGKNVKLELVEAGAPAKGPVVLQQVVTVAGKEIPVEGRNVKLYYDKNDRLKAMENSTADEAGLQVQGRSGDLTGEQAKEIVKSVLGLPEALIVSSKEFVHIDAVSGSARLVQKVEVAPPGKGGNIEVLVDSETKALLPITRGN